MIRLIWIEVINICAELQLAALLWTSIYADSCTETKHIFKFFLNIYFFWGGGFQVQSFQVYELPSLRVTESLSLQVAKFPSWKKGERGANERPGNWLVISGPMIDLKNWIQWCKFTDGHGDSMTELAHWGQFSENMFLVFGSIWEKLKFHSKFHWHLAENCALDKIFFLFCWVFILSPWNQV